MTTSPEGGLIPELTLGWRLRMARETTGRGLREFAEEIGVSPDTLTSAEHDRRKVREITINAYALASGVNREWIKTGLGAPNGPDRPSGKPADKLAALTEAKKARSGRGGRSTDQYFSPSPVAA